MFEKEVLSLDALVERKRVKIRSSVHPEGHFYEIRNFEDLGAIEFQAILSRHELVKRLKGTDQADFFSKLTSDDARLLTQTLDECAAALVLNLEPEVIAELGDYQKAQILEVWSDLATERAIELGGAEGESTAGQTGAGSSADSNPSTAAIPDAGPTSQ